MKVIVSTVSVLISRVQYLVFYPEQKRLNYTLNTMVYQPISLSNLVLSEPVKSSATRTSELQTLNNEAMSHHPFQSYCLVEEILVPIARTIYM